MKRIYVFIILSSLVCAGLSQAEVTSIEPQRKWPVRQVSSSSKVEVLTPELVWRINCGVDSDPLIGRLVAAASGQEGRVLLVDSQMSRVLVIAPDGSIERVVGCLGNGPGEITGAYRALQLVDGRIGIADGIDAPNVKVGTRGNIVFVDRKSDPAGELLAGGDPGSIPVCSVRDLRYLGEEIMATTVRSVVLPPKITSVLELSLLSPSSGKREIIARSLNSSDMRDQVARESNSFELFSGGRCDIDASGRLVWAIDRDNWALAVRQKDGTGFILQRESVPVVRTDDMKKEMRDLLGGGEDAEVFKHEPAIKSVRWRTEGMLWVEPVGVKLPHGAVACFDEISSEGELIRRIYLSVPAATTPNSFVVLEDGRMVLFEGFGSSETEDGGNIDSAVSLFQLRGLNE